MVTLTQIFISSTFRDLHDEREKVRDAILTLGHHPAGMEMFGARTVEQWRVIEDEIDNSDFYVVILGKCFGTTVPGEDISYTQKEFRYASSKGIPILGFIAKDEADLMADTDPDKIDKLGQFRTEVETSGITTAYWRNGDHLATQVVTALTREIYGSPVSVVDDTPETTTDYGEGIVLRPLWNFHNDIALRLERKARNVYGDTDRPYDKMYDADGIESFGYFAEVMIDLLRQKSGHENGRDDIDKFIKDLAPYIGKSGYEIPKKVAQGLFDRFLELLEK